MTNPETLGELIAAHELCQDGGCLCDGWLLGPDSGTWGDHVASVILAAPVSVRAQLVGLDAAEAWQQGFDVGVEYTSQERWYGAADFEPTNPYAAAGSVPPSDKEAGNE